MPGDSHSLFGDCWCGTKHYSLLNEQAYFKSSGWTVDSLSERMQPLLAAMTEANEHSAREMVEDWIKRSSGDFNRNPNCTCRWQRGHAENCGVYR